MNELLNPTLELVAKEYVNGKIRQMKRGDKFIPFNFWCAYYVQELNKKVKRKRCECGNIFYCIDDKKYIVVNDELLSLIE